MSLRLSNTGIARSSHLGSRCVLRRQLRLDHRRSRVAARASTRRIAALDRRRDHRAAAVLQQLLGAASILLMVAPGRTDADRKAGLNGVSMLARLVSFGPARVGRPRRVGVERCCNFVAGLIPASRNIGGIDVVLVFFRLVTREVLLGGVGHLRLSSDLRPPRAESPSRRSVHISSSPSP
jgi:hypothetical protein